MHAPRSSLVTVRPRMVLDVTHAREPFANERRAIGIGPDVPAVAVVLKTCAETVVAVGRRVYTVDEEAVAGPLETLRHGFRHSKAEGRRYRGVVLGLVALEEAAHAESITALSSPPNAPATIARKGSSNPLIESGAMRQSIRHELRRHTFGGVA